MFSRPQLAALIERVRTDVLSRLTQADLLRRADAEAYARVLGGLAHGLYGFIDWVSRQMIYDTAEAEYLDRWSSIWGVTRKAAAAATGNVTFTVLAGSTIPANTQLRALDGVLYQTTADATVTAPTATAPIAAVVPAAAGNRAAGQSLTLISPFTGVQPIATAGLLAGGADLETDAALRARLLARIQQPPHGGNANDYVNWAIEVAGVTRAWVYPGELGLGTLSLRFVRDNDGTGAAILPNAAAVAAVQAYLDARRPVTAQLTVVAPVAVPLNFSIQLTPNTATVQAAVQSELQDLITREAVPGGTLLLSHIRAAISGAAGETNNVVSAPAADVATTTGQLTTMGTITWL